MATFKETIKGIGKKVEDIVNKPVAKVAIPTASIGTTVVLDKKRRKQNLDIHKEQMESMNRLSNCIENLDDRIDLLEEGDRTIDSKGLKTKEKSTKRVLFKKRKEFSIEAGGFNKEAPKSVISEGIKKIAEESKLRSLDDSDISLKKIVEDLSDGESFSVNLDPGIDSRVSLDTLNLYLLGDVLVIFVKGLYNSISEKLNNVLDRYCRTFENTDYSSTFSGIGENCIIEVWISDESALIFLLKNLLDKGCKFNIIE